jgi:hypothetical protein
LSGLKPNDGSGSRLTNDNSNSDDEDEDVRKIMDRKVSMNEQNVIGMNFEKYNDIKPSQDIRRKIANYFQEYKETQDKNHAKNDFIDICRETSIS